MYQAYPLQWPVGYRRTNPTSRTDSRFEQTMDKVQQFLRTEISRLNGGDLNGVNLIVSTNIPLRKDGYLFADMLRDKLEDPGAAIYFKHKGKHISMCCDQYLRVWENLYALAKGIEAIRGMQRWGVSDFIDRAFTGFAALPESTTSETEIWESFGFSRKPATLSEVEVAYKSLVKKYHPDSPGGGDKDMFIHLTEQYKRAKMFFS